MTQQTGVVVHARPYGFAFVKPDSGGADVFVSSEEIARAGLDELWRGQRVAFDLVADRLHGKGPRGVRIAVIGDRR